MADHTFIQADVSPEAAVTAESNTILGKVEEVFSDAAKKAKELYESLSDGRHTGITGDFGKPMFFDPKELAEYAVQTTVIRNSEGSVTSVTRDNGSTTTFGYDKDQHLEKITFGDKYSFKLQDGVWQMFNDKGQNLGPLDGDVSVNKEGEIVFGGRDGSLNSIKHLDGSTTAYRSDQTRTETDIDGRVTSVTRPDNRTTTFDYGVDDQLEKITFGDGFTYKKEGKTWQMYDDQGKSIGQAEGNFKVNSDGEIIYTKLDGSLKSVKHRDGTTTNSRSDQTVIELDPDSNIVSLTRPDGKTTTFEYDKDQELEKITFGDGYVYKKENGGWVGYDDQGQTTGPIDGSFSVSADGEILYVNSDSTLESVKHRDGSRTVSRSDEETILERDSQERVTSITYKGGESNAVEYGKDGKPCKIINSTGSVWIKQNGSWNEYENGKRIGHIDGEVEVTSEGDIELTRNDGSKEITHRDGEVEKIPA